MKTTIVPFLAFLLSFPLGAQTSAADYEQWMGLRDVQSVSVTVLLDTAYRGVFSKEMLKSRLELELRKNGLPVGVPLPSGGSGLSLVLLIDGVHLASAQYAGTARFRTGRVTQTIGEKPARVLSSVWDTRAMPLGDSADQARAMVDMLVEQTVVKFSNDFLHANPKP